MIKFNYNEPEFKVVNIASQDVLTASVGNVLSDWEINKEDAIGSSDLGFGV